MKNTHIAMAVVGATPQSVGSAPTKDGAEKLATDWSTIHGGLSWTAEWAAADAARHTAALRPNNGRRVPRRMTAEEVAAFNA